jgi:MoaA/NifB/PqqE/SkfB family radical SAM enzyme
LSSITASIHKLIDIGRELGVQIPIRIKPTLNSVNFRAMPQILTWAVEQGATTIDIQPMREWTDETKQQLWLSESDLGDLEQVISQLLSLKAAGAPLETSEHSLRGIPNHFRRLQVAPEVSTCRIGLRVFSFSPEGLVETCGAFRVLGDLKRQSAREIWTGEIAGDVRRRTVGCRNGCPYGCFATKPIVHTIKRGLMVFGNPQNRSAAHQAHPIGSGSNNGNILTHATNKIQEIS